jgi:branched-subunit amino acid ABC-type transport system permease component
VNDLGPVIVTGISDGAVYAICALGLVLTYKTSGVFNFAHGAVAAASAYVFYQFRDRDHMPWGLAAVLALLVVGVIGGLLLERMSYALAEAPTVMRVVATVGLLVGLDSLLTAIYGASTIAFKNFLPQSPTRVGGVNIAASDFITLALAIVATVGLYLFFKRSRLGVAMQAVVDDPDLLSMQGISPVVVRRLAWTIGSCFASVSGMLLAPEIGINVSYLILLIIVAYGAAAIGLFSNLPLTFAGGIIIGVGINVLGQELSGSHSIAILSLAPNLPFLVLFAVMLFVPSRLLIEQGVRRVRRLRPMPTFKPQTVGVSMACFALLAIIVPLVAPAYDINDYTAGLAFAVLFMSLALLTWTSGQISLCQMAFAAVGASTFGHALAAGFPWLLALLVAGLIAMPMGALVAIPAIRLSGIYLAIATFGFGILVERLFFTSFLMFGNQYAIRTPRPHLLGLNLTGDKGYYYVTLSLTALCCVLVLLVRRSRLGRLLRGLADSPTALAAHGANTTITRVFVFCISAFLAGIGGALLAGVTQSGSEATYDFSVSLAMIAVLAFCWRLPILSPFIAAFLYQVLQVYPFFRDATVLKYDGVAFGILAIGVAVWPGLGSIRSSGRAQERDQRGSPVLARSAPVHREKVLT